MSTASRLLCSAFLVFASTLPVACGHDAGPPPSAPASAPDERARMVAWARQLEADPHPPGEEEESARLFTWLVNAPDVTVTVCDEVITPFVNEDVGFKPMKLFTFGSAAFVIEHPGPGAETEPASLAGVRSVLKAYEVMLGRGGSRSAVLDELRQKDQSGTLEAHVAAAWTKCRGQGA